MTDSLNIFYAGVFSRLLLSNDKPVREKCSQLQVAVHGTLWFVRECHERGLVPVPELCQWLAVLARRERRLPGLEVDRLRRELGCQ